MQGHAATAQDSKLKHLHCDKNSTIHWYIIVFKINLRHFVVLSSSQWHWNWCIQPLDIPKSLHVDHLVIFCLNTQNMACLSSTDHVKTIYEIMQLLLISKPPINSWLWHTIIMGHAGLFFTRLNTGNQYYFNCDRVWFSILHLVLVEQSRFITETWQPL